MKIYKSTDELIGKTPLVQLKNIKNTYHFKAKLFAKVEFFNPGGSAKDRIAKAMIDDAENKGLINQNTVIIEPTSGNTGIGLALMCAIRGYKAIIVMPSNMSVERINFMKAYGAEVVFSDASLGMKGAIAKANELKEQYPNSFIPSQFENPSNPMIHYLTTGPELYSDIDGKIDIFVAGIGTGGTISGVGKYLKEKNPKIKIVGVEPESSAFLSTGIAGKHKIQGIGAGFEPKTLDKSIYDEIIAVSNENAYDGARELATKEGLLVGISSGAAYKAALALCQRVENKEKNIVVLFPDSGDRYFSIEEFTK